MGIRKIFFILSLIIATVCLALGFAIAGQWAGVIFVILLLIIWILVNKLSPSSLWPQFCLVLSVIFIITGLYVGAPALLMIIGATAALAGWDLMLFNHTMKKEVPVDKQGMIEKLHFQSLLAACVIGCSIAAINTLFSLHIPFVLMFFMTAAFLFCFDRVLRNLKNK